MKICFVAPHTSDKASSHQVSNAEERKTKQNETNHSSVLGSHTEIYNDHRAVPKGRHDSYQH